MLAKMAAKEIQTHARNNQRHTLALMASMPEFTNHKSFLFF